MSAGFFSASAVTSRAPAVSRVPKCGACGLLTRCTSPQLPVSGTGARKILFVENYPEPETDATGDPVASPGVQYLRDILQDSGVALDDCHLTYAMICRPETNSDNDPKWKEKINKQVLYCQPNIRNLIDAGEYTMIVPMGFQAAKTVLHLYYREKVGQMRQWAGWKIPLQRTNTWICPTWSPSEVNSLLVEGDRQAPIYDVWLRRHLSEAMSLDGRPWAEVPDYGKQIRCLHDPREVIAWIKDKIQRWVAGDKTPMAFDWETDYLKPEGEGAEIVTAGFCWGGKETIAFPLVPELFPVMREFLESDIPKIGANNKFEDRWARKIFGIKKIRNWLYDCTLSAHHLDNRKDICSVKFQAFVRLGMEPWDRAVGPFLRDADHAMARNGIRGCRMRDLLIYNGYDAVVEYHLAQAQCREMREQNETHKT